MRNVTFQLVLKECVLPDYFVFRKLKNLLEGRSEFGEFDLEEIKEAIEIKNFTSYEGINRYLLSFSVDFSIADALDLDYTQKLILAFGKSFRDDTRIVEGVFRFEDSFMLEEIIEFHKEIYAIEMKIREVLNYILAYNFSRKELFSYLEEFEGVDFGNEKMRREPEYRKKVFNEFLEGELFHIIFTRYHQFKFGKEPKADKIYDFIKQSNSFEELYNFVNQERGITENLNSYHRTFVNDLSSNLQQIEDVRNEVMHNREIKETLNINRLTQKTDYKNAKLKVLDLINNFWEQERRYPVDTLKQAKFILQTLTDSIYFVGSHDIYYVDLNFEEQDAQDLDELKSNFLSIINNHLEIEDQDSLIDLINNKIDEIYEDYQRIERENAGIEESIVEE